MQQLLVMEIWDILSYNARVVVTRLCFFFNAICSKVIDPHKLDELENKTTIILCQLGIYFPPSFFDIMVHLIVHLMREIRLCDLIYLRWMHPVEWYMKVLKGYTKNQYHPLLKGTLQKKLLSFVQIAWKRRNLLGYLSLVMKIYVEVRVHGFKYCHHGLWGTESSSFVHIE